jgi:hypothetical protein
MTETRAHGLPPTERNQVQASDSTAGTIVTRDLRSQADIHMTKAIIDIAGPLGMSVHDHIIVGKNGHASMKGLRLI